VVLASVYALRLLIRSMHNRVGPRVRSHDIKLLDGAVLAPLVAVIVFLSFYPQFALHRSEPSVRAAVYMPQALIRAQRFRTELTCPPAYLQRFEETGRCISGYNRPSTGYQALDAADSTR